MSEFVRLLCPGDRQTALEAIATVLRVADPDSPGEDLASWAVGVAVLEALERGGFQIVRLNERQSATGYPLN